MGNSDVILVHYAREKTTPFTVLWRQQALFQAFVNLKITTEQRNRGKDKNQ